MQLASRLAPNAIRFCVEILQELLAVHREQIGKALPFRFELGHAGLERRGLPLQVLLRREKRHALELTLKEQFAHKRNHNAGKMDKEIAASRGTIQVRQRRSRR